MIGHASLAPPLVKHTAPVSGERRGLAAWQRRTLEALVAVLAFAVWGKLAYVGVIRLLARMEGMPVSGHWLLDGLSLLIGVSGSIAGVSALWLIALRAFGRTPMSLVGAPDDGPTDPAYRSDLHPDGVYRGERADVAGHR